MQRWIRNLALVVLVLAAAPLVLSAPAFAQYREFNGKIDSVNAKKLIVDNRMGDKVSFDKTEEVTVEGQGKTTWDDLKKGDWVTVSWKFIDKPRKAYKVLVQPPKEEEGEEL